MMKKASQHLMIDNQGYWLVFSRSKILVAQGDPSILTTQWPALPFLHHYQDNVEQLPPLEDPQVETPPVFILDLQAEHVEQDGFEWVSLRELLMTSTQETFGVIARAWQYVHFLRTHRYCGQCGSPTERVDWEMAVQCHQCHHRCYPRVSPCVIVAIYEGTRLLLAKGVRHKDSNMYSTLAGFVESGESLEQAVHREVFEEVGVKVKDIEYFGSQPWPFPHSLMVGYIARYDSGDINVQEDEILDAQWFDINDLPKIPPKLSIAGQLIDAVVKRQQ